MGGWVDPQGAQQVRVLVDDEDAVGNGSLEAIGGGLELDGVATARRAKWHASTVHAVLESQDTAALVAGR